jgi:GDSL-like Lipase/Acylhydrolase family
MRPPLATGLLLCMLALLPPAAAAQEHVIDWEMAPRLGEDADGDHLLDYADSAQEVAIGPFAVEIFTPDRICNPHSTYSWSIAGTDIGSGVGRCRLRRNLPREGIYEVSLEVESQAGEVLEYHRDVVVQDWLVVSIGDSVGSGEGNPSQGGFLRRAHWQSQRCHRSTLAAPVQAALALERADSHTSVTFVHLACSGAGVKVGLLEPYEGADVSKQAQPPLLAPQVSELEAIASQRPIDSLLVSAGANDVYFGPLVAFCIRQVDCVSKRFDPSAADTGSKDQAGLLPVVIKAALVRLEDSYRDLGAELSPLVDASRVLVVDYFDPTRDAQGATCRKIGIPFLPRWYIDRDESTFAQEQLLAPLNEAIAEAAKREGWLEVTGVAESFRRHGYCARGESWIRTLPRSLVTQAGWRARSRVLGTMHPNERGHQALATLISGSLQRRLYSNGGAAAELEPGEGGDLLDTETGGGGGMASDHHDELERDVLTGLIVLAIIALLSGSALSRRLFRSSPQRKPGTAAAPAKIRTDLPRIWQSKAVVDGFSEMLEESSEWVHRRVESIAFIDERTIRRRMSVDFTPRMAEGSETTLVPLAMLAKGVLTRFDLRDEEERSVPMRTSEENATLSTQYMLAVAAEATGRPASDRLRELCWTIARGEPPEADLAIAEISERITIGQEPASLASPKFLELSTTFAARFPIVVELDDTSRRVLKFASDETVMKGPERQARWGIFPAVFQIDVPELGDAGSRHIEFLTADGLETRAARIVGRQPNGQRVTDRTNAGDGREAHLVVNKVQRATRGVAEVRLWVQRRGILTGGPLLALFAATALTACWFALPELATNSRDAASLLLAVPAAFVTYLGARDPHPLTAAMLWGTRVLIVLAGSAGFLGAGALALGYSAETLRVLLAAAAAIAWFTVLGLAAIYLAPRWK